MSFFHKGKACPGGHAFLVSAGLFLALSALPVILADPFVGQYGIDKQKLIDVLDARATRSKSFNADIIALHNGSVLFAQRYKK